jgi:thiol-disulfide isomerase/thioredoxin
VRSVFVLLTGFLLIGAARANQPDKNDTNVPVELKGFPADSRAYMAASHVADPQSRIDAYRKVMKDYPKSGMARFLDEEILGVLTENFPAKTEEINAQIDLVLKDKKGDELMSAYDSVASKLADGGVFLDRAEKYSRTALEQFKEPAFIASMKKAYGDAKMTIPDDAELHKQYLMSRARYLATLGAVYVKEGKIDEGEKLLKEADRDGPGNSSVTRKLGEVELKAGRQDAALDYFVQARLSGDVNPKDEEQLKSLYQKTHGDSLAGYDAFLDEHYEKLFPEPFPAEAYQPSAKRSNRVALIEMFTGSGCPPCAGADVAMDQVLNHYSRKDLALIVYHEHRPHPDPMTNPSGIRRYDYYDAKGVPTMVIDGVGIVGGASRESAQEVRDLYNKINTAVDKDLDSPAEAIIEANASREGNVVTVHATADQIKGSTSDVHMQIALVELRQRFSGENGIRFHPMVVRGLANLDSDGFAVKSGEPTKVDYSFDVDKMSSDLKSYIENYQETSERYGKFKFIEQRYTIDPADLAIVVFLQDMKTKHILQASYVNVSGSGSQGMKSGE